MEFGGHSVLVIPVPVLEPWVRERTRYYDASFVGIEDTFCNAHITVLGPWMPRPSADALATVGSIASATPAFDFAMNDLGEFPNGIIYLDPEPSTSFSALTAALAAAFPDFPPYGGAFGDVVPHLTLDQASAGVTVDSVRASLGSVVPARSRATQIDLQWWANDDCHVMASWPLKTD